MGILTPGAELDKLFLSVITDPDAVTQEERKGLGAGFNKKGYKNIQTVAGLNIQVGSNRSGISVNINNKGRSQPAFKAYRGEANILVIVVDQLHFLSNGTGRSKNGIKTDRIGRNEKEGISIQIRLLLAGYQHQTGKNEKKQ